MTKPKSESLKADVVTLYAEAPKNAKAGSELFQGVAVEKPPVPVFIKQDKPALAHWRYITKELEKVGLISRLDQGALGSLCMYYSLMVDACEKLAVQGQIQDTPNGYKALSAAQIAYDRASNNYTKLALQFGLTVRSRKTMNVENPNQGDLGF